MSRKTIYEILKKAYFLGYYEAKGDKRKDKIRIDDLIDKISQAISIAYSQGVNDKVETLQEYLDLNTDKMFGTVDYETFGQRVSELMESWKKELLIHTK